MSKFYIVFNDDNTLLTRLPIDASVGTPIPANTTSVTESLWLQTMAETDGIWTRAADGTISKQPLPVVAPDYTAIIAAARFEREVAGIYWGGFFIATDRESQTKLLQERSAVQTDLRTDPSGWKCGEVATGLTVSRSTTNAEMLEISAAAYKYVAACFAREGELLEALAAGTYTADMLAQGWPDNGATTTTTTDTTQ